MATGMTEVKAMKARIRVLPRFSRVAVTITTGATNIRGKWIGDAAGQVQQCRQLQHVEAQIDGGFAVGEAMGRARYRNASTTFSTTLAAMAPAQ